MLKKSHITKFEVYGPEWQQSRLSKFTSSRISCLMGVKGISEGGRTYIYQKVGESLTGLSNDKEFGFDEDLDWGNKYENDAIMGFGRKFGLQYLVVQKLIQDPATQFASTPDALWIHGECKLDDNEYNVSTLEVKCPRTYHNFIQLFRCKSPADLKKENSKYYWQVLDQMQNCGSAVGYFSAFHPFFPAPANQSVIKFRKMDLWDDFKLLELRKREAVKMFEDIRLEMTST